MFLLEEKRKHMPVKVDSERSHLFEIARDKAQHSRKYHFLKLKNLTDEQIFRDFKDFEMNFDTKQLGNQYLEESKGHLKKSEGSDRLQSSRIQPSQR